MGKNIANFWTETEGNKGELFSLEQLKKIIGGMPREEAVKLLNDLRTDLETKINDLTLYLSNDDPEEGEIGQLIKIKIALEDLAERIDNIMLFKFPNATIKGNPTINHGQISDFTQENYLILPSTFDVKGRGFEIALAFTTGADITIPQNILGSQYCVALFVQAGKLNLRVSSNGSSWDIVNYQSNLTIEANKTYYIKITFDRLRYILSYSVNGEDYIEDGYVTAATEPYSGIIYIGVGNNFNNPFKGIINLNKCEIKFNNVIVWQGMDDVGLATRLATDLSNIDRVGLEVLNSIIANNKELTDAIESIDVANQSILRQQGEIEALRGKVSELETSKDLGVIVIGTPTIHGSQVSAFTADNYLMMPRIIEFDNNPWQLDFQFTTGTDVQTQQNIIDSAFGLALAVSGGKLVIALSSNGTDWNLGAHTGYHTIAPNTSYFVRMTFDGSKYVVAISTDRKTYTQDIVVANTASLYPVQIYIGKSPNNSHIFTGSIYLYYAVLTINNEIVWTGTLGGELKDQLYNLEQELDTLSLEVDENSDSWGHYAKRPPVDLSVKIVEENKIINRDGNMVERVGWNVAEFEAERGNTYKFNPGTMASDVCIFAEKVVREEVRNIDYKYVYDDEGRVASASAAYNGASHTYTYTYGEEGETIITDDQTGDVIEALPLTFIASVGSYIPMTVLPDDSELPLDGYCRLVSHFESDTHITIAVSYNTENAGMLMGVKRDGTVSSICSQLSTLGKRISSLSKRVEDALEGLEIILKTI